MIKNNLQDQLSRLKQQSSTTLGVGSFTANTNTASTSSCHSSNGSEGQRRFFFPRKQVVVEKETESEVWRDRKVVNGGRECESLEEDGGLRREQGKGKVQGGSGNGAEPRKKESMVEKLAVKSTVSLADEKVGSKVAVAVPSTSSSVSSSSSSSTLNRYQENAQTRVVHRKETDRVDDSTPGSLPLAKPKNRVIVDESDDDFMNETIAGDPIPIRGDGFPTFSPPKQRAHVNNTTNRSTMDPTVQTTRKSSTSSALDCSFIDELSKDELLQVKKDYVAEKNRLGNEILELLDAEDEEKEKALKVQRKGYVESIARIDARLKLLDSTVVVEDRQRNTYSNNVTSGNDSVRTGTITSYLQPKQKINSHLDTSVKQTTMPDSTSLFPTTKSFFSKPIPSASANTHKSSSRTSEQPFKPSIVSKTGLSSSINDPFLTFQDEVSNQPKVSYSSTANVKPRTAQSANFIAEFGGIDMNDDPFGQNKTNSPEFERNQFGSKHDNMDVDDDDYQEFLLELNEETDHSGTATNTRKTSQNNSNTSNSSMNSNNSKHYAPQPIFHSSNKPPTRSSSFNSNPNRPPTSRATSQYETNSSSFTSNAPSVSRQSYPPNKILHSSSSTAIMNTAQTSRSNTMKPLSTKTQSFPWSHDVVRALRGIFKLKEFRENQLEAINATLGGKDCFVLMPTGGGKSLTYQLPSVISTGVTRGITIVITPLLSLMQDQIQSLLSKGIPALSLFGTQTSDQRKFAMRELNKDKPACKLLYVTPEMLNKSTMCQNTIARLHKSKFLARFVVDEAHCLSQWGHDFRPDYKELQHLKRQYPDIPIMALTATANDKVQTDIISILGIKNCVCFRQSFNRANLIYYVRPKSKSVVDDIYSFISTKHRNECGIIYCMSKKNCEDMCHTLQKKFKISCNYYHAGLSKSDREKIQADWASGRFKIIVATVAFGMGIDKPDVRYVIHHSLPHSLENYYQETGRAGRDGNESECVMFYNFADKAKIESLIDKGDGSWAQKKLSKDNLRLVIAYCENKIECRRQQVLAYFGENFNPKECHQTCDNCMYRKEVEVKDVTSDAQNILSMVRDISRDKITLLYALDVWRGSKVSKIVQNGHDKLRYHGSGKNYTKTEAERIFHQLVIKELLAEYSEINGMGYSCSYLKLGKNAEKLLRNQTRFSLAFPKEDSNGVKQKSKKRPRVQQTEPDFDDFNLDTIESENEDIRVHVKPNSNTRQQPPRDPIDVDILYEDDNYDDELDVVKSKQKSTTRKKSKKSNESEKDVDEELARNCYDELRGLRSRLCTELSLKPDSIFTDTVLLKMAQSLPTSIVEFCSVKGVTDAKYRRFGQKFHDIVNRYAKLNKTKTKQKSTAVELAGDGMDDDIEISPYFSGRKNGGAGKSSKNQSTSKPALSTSNTSLGGGIRPLRPRK